ncbi:hypothetical protein [Micromonospora sp. NPDC001898]|uniref:hypothetical protein n=1 Tax=Micromonospora sp. NPDC001898 TaxID=3364221 RepID=UPI0036CC8E5A
MIQSQLIPGAETVISPYLVDPAPGLPGDVPLGPPNDTWVEATGRYRDRAGRNPVDDADIPYPSWSPGGRHPSRENEYE